jgi:hypothetical protein
MNPELESPTIKDTEFNLDIVLYSDRPVDSSLFQLFKQIGFSVYSKNQTNIIKSEYPAGSIIFLSSPKRVSGCLSISIINGTFLESKHSLSDFVINYDEHTGDNLSIIIRNYTLDFLKNRVCREKVKEGLIKIIPKINPNVLKESFLSRVIMRSVDDYLLNYSTPNMQDLKHQTSFFLTTVNPEELFENFSDFTIKQNGEYSGNYPIVNKGILEYAVNLQAKVVERFVHDAPDDVSALLSHHWPLSKEKGTLFKKDKTVYFKCEFEMISVELREVSLEYALSIHEHLHYIHAARGEMAFGLFLDGDDIPFSVLTVDRIDRNYKEEALLLAGLNPSTCLEFSRLFSRPGSPMNTSSFILSSVRDFLKKKYPSTQAIITSFMPAYASGKSMICSKFDNCLFSKELSHKFYDVDGILVHKVRRRQDGNCVKESIIPLFPTLYLICKMRSPNNNFWRIPSGYMPYYSKIDIEEV